MSEELNVFVQYAQAFEESYKTDDWEIVGASFDENIAWAGAGLPSRLLSQGQGRTNTAASLKSILNTLDRRFDTRDPQLAGAPIEIPSGVHFGFVVTYTREGLPPLKLRGEEWDLFRNGKLAMHYELIHNGDEVVDYLQEYDSSLLPAC